MILIFLKIKFLILFFRFYIIIIYISASRTPLFLMILFVILVILFTKKFREIFLRSLLILAIFIGFEGFINFGKTDLVFGKTNTFHRVFKITFIQFTDHYFNLRNNLKETNDHQLESKNENSDIEKSHEKNKFTQLLGTLKVFSVYHQNHYKLAIKLFKEKPIFGNGPKGFRNYCRNVGYVPFTKPGKNPGMCSTHPHNYFFQILSELGLVGISFYLFGLFFVIIKYVNFLNIKKNIYRSEFSVISLGLLILFFPIVPSGNFFNNWLSIINYYYIGIYLYLYNQIYQK